MCKLFFFIFIFIIYIVLGVAIFYFKTQIENIPNPAWHWTCNQGKCEKQLFNGEKVTDELSLSTCQLFCGSDSSLWPKPTSARLQSKFVHLNINNIDVFTKFKKESKSEILFHSATTRFNKIIHGKQQDGISVKGGGQGLLVEVDYEKPNEIDINLNTNESYSLSIREQADGRIIASIKSKNFFGARHALETLTQLVVYDDLRNEIVIASDVDIKDEPAFPYRGILLDTARNYYSVDSIKRTLDAMAASKMNMFHWHLTDTQSFPIVLPKQPELSKLGALSPAKIYRPEDIKDIVEYAKVRGVLIVPEFDAPAHVGEGWQNTDFVECFKAEPWNHVCVEPPCGQFNPTKSGLYDALDDIYGDMFELFQPTIFHMGGDEVSITCWNQTQQIVQWMKNEQGWATNESDFIKLWVYFQTEALNRLRKHSVSPDIPIVMWTSTLTKQEYVENLPKDQYIIQIWTTGDDNIIRTLLDKGYRLILSNYDALYLDCGFGAWIGSGNNWCSPYKGWHKVYDNSPSHIGGKNASLILGSEVTLWSEQSDEHSLDNRLWPRSAALAERLWSNPNSGWQNAERRILIHRERLVEQGIAADSIEPEWCIQNEGYCHP